MKKRFLSLLLVAAVLLAVPILPVSAAETVLKVNYPETLPKAGEEFEVAIELSGNPGFSALQFALSIDKEVFHVEDYEVGVMLDNALKVVNPEHADGLFFASASANNIEGNGVIITVHLISGQDIIEWQFISLREVKFTDEKGIALGYVIEGNHDNSNEKISGNSELQNDTAEENEAVTTNLQSPENEIGGADESKSTQSESPSDEREAAFPDTVDHWSNSCVAEALKFGIFRGYPDGLFRPDLEVTRGQFVTVLYRMSGNPDCNSSVPFLDVEDQSEEFRTAICWAYMNGYIDGRSETSFDPTGSITRQEAMKILFGYAGGISGLETFFTLDYEEFFEDSSEIAKWARPAMYWGIYHSLINGVSAHVLGPTATATRAQVAKILVTYMEEF